MAGKDHLVMLVRDVRRRVQNGEGDAVLAEAEAGGGEAKWLLVKGEAKLRMDSPREGLVAAEEAASKFKSQADTRGHSLALQVLADCHLALHECAEVLALSVEAISICWELGDKAAEAAVMHTCAGAFQVQWRYPEATRAATRAATLFREAGDKMGEAIALETAANASVSQAPSETPQVSNLMKQNRPGPPGGQNEMDAVRFGQTSVLYDKKPWQPISKFHPTLIQRESLVGAKKDSIAPRVIDTNRAPGTDGKPLFQPKSFSWGRPAHRLDQAFYHMVLTAGDKII